MTEKPDTERTSTKIQPGPPHLGVEARIVLLRDENNPKNRLLDKLHTHDLFCDPSN